MCPKSVVSFVGGAVKGVANVASDAVEYAGKKVKNTVKDVSGVTAAEKKAKEE
mgnify:CR=1 FL=1